MIANQYVLYCIVVGDPVIKGGGPISRINPAKYLCMSRAKQGPELFTSYVVILLCSASSVKMRGNCSFC